MEGPGWVTGLTEVIRASGPIGFVVAGLLVAGIAGIILYARTTGLFDGLRTEKQKTEFQGQRALRVELEEAADENAALRDDVRELRAEVSLLRRQLRILIDLIRAGRAGPEALDLIDMDEAGPGAAP
jgi:hypothetical protein